MSNSNSGENNSCCGYEKLFHGYLFMFLHGATFYFSDYWFRRAISASQVFAEEKQVSVTKCNK